MESSGISTTGHPVATSGSPTMGSPVPRGALAGSYIASPGGPGRPAFGSPGFVTSTPQVGVGQAVIRPGFTRSSKHDGLCMYFARILEYVFKDTKIIDFLIAHLWGMMYDEVVLLRWFPHNI